MKRNLFFAVLPFFTFPILGVAQSVVYPDLQVITPISEISIGTSSTGARELRFSHITWNAGVGPLEIRPQFNASTGFATSSQRLYTRNASGALVFVRDDPIAVPMQRIDGDDYRFPLSGFWLYTDNNGKIGTKLAATSPKTDFCMTEDFKVSGATVDGATVPPVPNTPASVVYQPGNCGDPNGILGLSVGWGDKYDYLDTGENIDLTGVPDGVYWLRSVANPQHLLQESNPSNNLTDTRLRISGNTVTVLQQLTNKSTPPTDSTPPTVTMTSPAPGAVVTGVVTLSATVGASPAVAQVQFLVDGKPVGGALTTPSSGTTYSTTWDTGNAPGPHTLTAQATSQATASGPGFIGTAPPVSVTAPTQLGSLVLDQTLSVDAPGTTATTAAFNTPGSNELLLALVGADGPSASQGQTVAVSGAGLSWTLVVRTNTQFGTAEVWAATAASALTNAQVTSTESRAGFHQSLTLLLLHGTSGVASVGARASANALQGGPSVNLTTTGNGSLVLGVGNDWDRAVARTLGPNQQLFHQWVDSATGDTYWVQGTTVPAGGTAVTLNDTAPTNDRWNFSAVEVLAAAAPPPPADTTPPTISIATPPSNSIVAGSVTVTANATDDVALRATNPVLFYLDAPPTNPLPGPVTVNGSQYSVTWDTTRTANGVHSVSAVATDTSNNSSTASATGLTVSNPPQPVPCFILDATASARGQGLVTTTAFRTSLPGERLFAFVGSDGPATANGQTAAVSGAGLSWTLVKRANAQFGTSEVWTALAPNALSNATVTARQGRSGYRMSLYVVAYQGVGGVGNSVAASAATGAPRVQVTASKGGSLFYAVGNDWDRAVARTVGTNQLLDDQWVDKATGDTYWVQNETFPPALPVGTVVTLNDTAPKNDRWNFVGVEILNDD